MRHLLADGWRSLGSAPRWGRVCARHVGAGATSFALHAAVIVGVVWLSLPLVRNARALAAATKRTSPLALFSVAPSANTNASAQNERPSAKPLLQAGKEAGPAKVGIEMKPGDSTLTGPGFTFDVAKLASRGTALFPFLTRTLSFNVDERREKRATTLVNPFAIANALPMREPPLVMSETDLQRLVDRAWSRRERWAPFQIIRALADVHNPDIGQLPTLLREYVNQNVLQPYVETRMRDPRVWTQLGLVADHELFLDYIADYVSRHPGTKGSIELLFMLDILVQSSLDTLHVFMEIEPDRDLQWTRRTNPAAFETLVKIRDYYVAQRKRLGLDSYRALGRHYDQIRTQILTTIMRTAPDGYRVDDARYLLGELHWRRGRPADAKRIWTQMRAGSPGRYADAGSAVLMAMRESESRPTAPSPDPRRPSIKKSSDDIEDRLINAIVDGEYQRWMSSSRTRLQHFGYVLDSF